MEETLLSMLFSFMIYYRGPMLVFRQFIFLSRPLAHTYITKIAETLYQASEYWTGT